MARYWYTINIIRYIWALWAWHAKLIHSFSVVQPFSHLVVHSETKFAFRFHFSFISKWEWHTYCVRTEHTLSTYTMWYFWNWKKWKLCLEVHELIIMLCDNRLTICTVQYTRYTRAGMQYALDGTGKLYYFHSDNPFTKIIIHSSSVCLSIWTDSEVQR